MADQIMLQSVAVVPGASVLVGWFRRAQLNLYTYSDGSVILGYPEVRQPLIVHEIAKMWPRG